ncbi:MAG: hypothetical protein ACXV8L_07775 [Ilumatobacteraceae bacterium]
MASETMAPKMPPPPVSLGGPDLPPPNVGLPPRVGIALLTLQLRASLQEAAVAEAEHTRLDPDSALCELRARLVPLIEERRRLLNEALEVARVDAAAAIAAAHREASAIVADASEQADLTVPEVVIVPTLSATSAVEVSRQLIPALPPINVVIDAEAFARVFATVLATVLEERVSSWPIALPTVQALPERATERVRVKSSFWGQARHLDIFLSGLAVVIVLVILFSWLA